MSADRDAVRKIVEEVVRERLKATSGLGARAPKGPVSTRVPIGISNRHGHLTAAHVETLFGKGKRLTVLRPLLQPDQFACNETIHVATSQGMLKSLRIIGPERKYSQVEIARTDAFALGLKPPMRQSGELDASAGCVLIGPAGSVVLTEGVILAGRHLHCHTSEGEALGLKNRQIIRVRISGDRGGLLENVLVRVGEIHRLELHIDTDEGNALGVKKGDTAELLI